MATFLNLLSMKKYLYSKYNQDLWSVFQATDTWDISKVKITIDDNNKGKDDNG